MAAWEWRAYDLGSGVALGSIEMSNWSHTDTLKDSGAFTATMTGRTDAIRRDYLGMVTVGKTVIVPIRNGVPFGYAGVVWRLDPPDIAGASLLSYLDAQTLDTTKTYAATDQHTLIADLVNWVQTQPGGTAQIDTSQVGTSGVLRDQTWNVWEQKIIGEAIRQKGDNLGGYDFDVRVEYDAGVLVRRLRLWTPRRGRYYVDTQTNPTFELDGERGNIRTLPAVPRDGLKMFTEVVALGWETNSTTHERLIARSIRSDLLALGWPRLVKVLDLPDIKDLTTLQAHADGYAHLYGMAEIDEIVLEVDPDHETWPLGSWDLGDDCRVVIPAGVHPWFPDGFNEIRRVMAHDPRRGADGETFLVTTGRLLGT
jgi:hypothetical protein